CLGDLMRLLRLGPLAWSGLGLHTMIHEARARVAELRPKQPLSPRDERFFAQLERVARAAGPCLQSPENYASPWGSMTGSAGQKEDLLAEPHYFFSGDGALAFLLVRPVEEAGSFTAALGSVTAARSIIDAMKGEFSDLEMGLTGLPVLETDEMVAAERDTRFASWLALAAVAGLFLVVYRGVAYPALTVVTLLVG